MFNNETKILISFSDLSAVHQPIVSSKNILLPIMHIKSGVCSKLLKSLMTDAKNESLKDFLKKRFGSTFCPTKIQGKQVNQIIDDPDLYLVLTQEQKGLWKSFGKVVKGFLGKNRSRDYQKLVRIFMNKVKEQKIRMTYKMHLLHCHLDEFPPNNSDFSEENGEKLHQFIKKSWRRYHPHPVKKILVDYSWHISASKAVRGRKRRVVWFERKAPNKNRFR